MRIFALSDVHADFEPNARWLKNLSLHDYQADVLILAGDVADSLPLLEWSLGLVARRFQAVLFVPGNHELWTRRDQPRIDSFEKFERVRERVQKSGASMETFRTSQVAIVPLLGWYDYSFGLPSTELKDLWMDFHACAWPPGYDVGEIAARFLALNAPSLDGMRRRDAGLRAARGHEPCFDSLVRDSAEPLRISFSHFLPRLELVPKRSAASGLDLSPVLGSVLLDRQVREVGATIHVYGHSHVNRRVVIDGVTYVNNAFGYPHESAIAAKRLLCLLER
ncbi:MAG TPA: metallophosphoesterase [Polyangiaceae bacterium]|nr:metallophosphoesterase [Polyangiaceae bacterium]